MDKNEVLVSIRCLAYNHAPYIRQCLEGFVIQKTNFRIEAVVHDDASTDGTAEIIREYAERYPDLIKPIFETENQYSKHDGSLGRIVNSACVGKYIAMCEGDDYWIDPYKLQKQVDFLEGHPEYGLCYAKARTFEQRTRKYGKIIGSYCSNHLDLLEKRGSIPTLTTVFRKSCSEGYEKFVEGHRWLMGDSPLWLYISHNSKIFFLNEVVAVYRILENSASGRSSYEKRKSFIISSYEMRCFFAKTYGYRDLNSLERTCMIDLFNEALVFKEKVEIEKYFRLVHDRNWKLCVKYLLYRLGIM